MQNGLLEKTEMDNSPHSMNTAAYVPSTVLTLYVYLYSFI